MLYYPLDISSIYVTQIDMTKTTCIQFFKPAANFNSKQRAAPESVVKNREVQVLSHVTFLEF